MEQYCYSFAGLSMVIESPIPLTVTAESEPFLQPGICPEPADHKILLRPCNALPPCPSKAVDVDTGSYIPGANGTGLVYHRLFPGEEPVVLVETTPEVTFVHYLPRGESWVRESLGLINALGLDNLMLRHDRLLLHASFIRWQGHGILFSAPSGTGKSTQADLWAKHQNATVINGDRAGLSCCQGRWYAHGLPFAGSSQIFRKETAPVSLVVCLSQGKENVATRLSPLDALRRLLPEINIRRWDKESVNRATGLLMELITQVPVYHLSCRPDGEATEVIKKLLD